MTEKENAEFFRNLGIQECIQELEQWAQMHYRRAREELLYASCSGKQSAVAGEHIETGSMYQIAAEKLKMLIRRFPDNKKGGDADVR